MDSSCPQKREGDKTRSTLISTLIDEGIWLRIRTYRVDSMKIPSKTIAYKNGERCIIRNCPFKDVTFHHTNYKKNLGFYVCWLHHILLYHPEKVTMIDMIKMMKKRNILFLGLEHRKNGHVRLVVRM